MYPASSYLTLLYCIDESVPFFSIKGQNWPCWIFGVPYLDTSFSEAALDTVSDRISGFHPR